MNTNTWQEYEQDMLGYTIGYTVTEFKGRGSYEARKFKKLEKAQEFYRLHKKVAPHARIIIYAVCQPPNRQLTVSLPVSDHSYEMKLA
jgi:hypothetical protein|tara:strand:- start:1096 stop:1359 length:264 start_codon:yes stop_codon:yes gene_type:complete